MFKFLVLIFNIYYILIFSAFSDINIIKTGQIIKSKPYSVNEATLVVSKSKKIYICSISNDLTKCILSNKKIK